MAVTHAKCQRFCSIYFFLRENLALTSAFCIMDVSIIWKGIISTLMHPNTGGSHNFCCLSADCSFVFY